MDEIIRVLQAPNSACPGLFFWLLNASYQAGILIGIIWLGLRIFSIKPAPARFYLWLFALLGVALLPAISPSLPHLRPLWVLQRPAEMPEMELVEFQLPPASGVTPEVTDYEPILAEEPVEFEPPEAAPIETASTKESPWPKIKEYWPLSLTAAWILGAVFFLARLLRGHLAIRRLKRNSEEIALARVLDVARETAAKIGLKRNMRLLASSDVSQPVSSGIFHPVVILPEEFIKSAGADELKPILIHEFAHIKRCDFLINLFQRLLEAVFFFHPLIWIASRNLRLSREEICDNWVLEITGERKSYARSLAHFAQVLSARRLPATVALIHRRPQILRRIEMILDERRKIATRLSKKSAFSILLLAAFILPLISAFPFVAEAPAAPEAKEDEKAPVAVDEKSHELSRRLPVGKVVTQVLRPEHFRTGKVLDIETGLLIPKKRSQAYLEWGKLAPPTPSPNVGMLTRGLQLARGPTDSLGKPLRDLWLATKPEGLPEFRRSARDIFVYPNGIKFPWVTAFRTPSGVVGILELTKIEGENVHVRYKILGYIPLTPGGRAVSFDGVGDFLEVPDSALLDISDEFTVEAWLKVGEAVGERAILSKEVPWKSGYTLIVEGLEGDDGFCNLTFGIGDGARFRNLTVPGILEKGKWAHVAAIWNRGRVSLMLNSEIVGRSVFPKAAPARLPLMIGKASADLGRHFKGDIEEVRIWSVARSENKIRSYMGRTLTGKEPGLVACWTFSEGSGQVVQDISPNHNDARLGSLSGPDDADPKWIPSRSEEKPATEKPEKEKSPARAPAERPESKQAWLELSGRVVDDETGEPVQNCALQWGWPNAKDPSKIGWGGNISYLSQRKDGSFHIRREWPKSAKVWLRVLADGYLPQPVTPQPLIVPASNVEVRLRRGLVVRGTVVDHTGKPVPGAQVFLGGNQGLQLVDGRAEHFFGSKTVSDEDGNFALSGAGDGLNSIIVSAPSLNVWQEPVTEPGREMTIKLPEPASLVLRYDIEGDEAEARFHLQIKTWEMKEWKGVVGSTQNPTVLNKGQTVLKNITPGVYDLARSKQLRLHGRVRRGAFCDRRTVTLEAGKTTQVNFVRKTGQPITGEVIGLRGAGVPGALIYVKPAAATGDPYNQDEWKLTTFDAVTCGRSDGYRFRTARIPPGSYTVIANAYKPERRGGVIRLYWQLPDFIGIARVTVKEKGPPPYVRIEMKPRPPRPVKKEPQKTLSPEDAAVKEKLQRRISFDFTDVPFGDLIEYLRNVGNMKIAIDSSLVTAEDLRTPITARVTDVTIETALKQVLVQMGLDYVIRDGAVFISHRFEVMGEPTLAIYGVRDVIAPIRDFEPPKLGVLEPEEEKAPPPLTEEEKKKKVDEEGEKLAKLIRDTIEPGIWWLVEENYVRYRDGQLIVRAPEPIQVKIQEFLENLRQERALKVTVSMRFLRLTPEFLEEIEKELKLELSPIAGVVSPPAEEKPLPPAVREKDYFLRENELKAFLGRVQKSDKAKIMTASRITLFNKQRGYVGIDNEMMAYISDIKPAEGEAKEPRGVTPILGWIRTGTGFDVRPTISADKKYVLMDMYFGFVNITGFGEVTAETGQTIGMPLVGVSEIKTTLKVPDGETMLTGGLRYTPEEGEEDALTEILILVTPHIIIQEEVEVTPPKVSRRPAAFGEYRAEEK